MAVATSAFQWNERYSVNIEVLDRQHRSLFATVNELNMALAEGRGHAVTDGILQKLVDYALMHFAAEEALMREHDFPGLAAHRLEHDCFSQKVAEFLQEYREGKAGLPVSLMFFLQSWLKEHILKTDQGYSGFLTARGVK